MPIRKTRFFIAHIAAIGIVAGVLCLPSAKAEESVYSLSLTSPQVLQQQQQAAINHLNKLRQPVNTGVPAEIENDCKYSSKVFGPNEDKNLCVSGLKVAQSTYAEQSVIREQSKSRVEQSGNLAANKCSKDGQSACISGLKNTVITPMKNDSADFKEKSEINFKKLNDQYETTIQEKRQLEEGYQKILEAREALNYQMNYTKDGKINMLNSRTPSFISEEEANLKLQPSIESLIGRRMPFSEFKREIPIVVEERKRLLTRLEETINIVKKDHMTAKEHISKAIKTESELNAIMQADNPDPTNGGDSKNKGSGSDCTDGVANGLKCGGMATQIANGAMQFAGGASGGKAAGGSTNGGVGGNSGSSIASAALAGLSNSPRGLAGSNPNDPKNSIDTKSALDSKKTEMALASSSGGLGGSTSSASKTLSDDMKNAIQSNLTSRKSSMNGSSAMGSISDKSAGYDVGKGNGLNAANGNPPAETIGDFAGGGSLGEGNSHLGLDSSDTDSSIKDMMQNMLGGIMGDDKKPGETQTARDPASDSVSLDTAGRVAAPGNKDIGDEESIPLFDRMKSTIRRQFSKGNIVYGLRNKI